MQLNMRANSLFVAGLMLLCTHGTDLNVAVAGESCEPAWHPFTAGGEIGVNNEVSAVTEWNGDLVVGGEFTTAGGQTVNRIARWDGDSGGWQPFISGGEIGVGGTVHALTVWNGDLIAGGTFLTAGGQTVNRIARWDGVIGGWQPFESGDEVGVNFTIRSLTVWNGNVVAAGPFTMAGGQTMNRIARWDGSEWHPFISGGQTGVNGTAWSVTVWNGDLIVAGEFTTAGGQTVNRIARWDGLAWHPFTSGGQIGVGGQFGSTSAFSLTAWNGDLVAAGNFEVAGGQTVNGIARWDDVSGGWHPFTSGGQTGVDGDVWSLSEWNASLVAGGEFFTAGGQLVNYIARWDSSEWHPFTAGGPIGVGDIVYALTVWDGDLIVGGRMIGAGTQVVNRIARWDGCLEPPRPGDLNGDGVINVSDLLILLGAWGACNDCPEDLNGDGQVNVVDMLILLSNWG